MQIENIVSGYLKARVIAKGGCNGDNRNLLLMVIYFFLKWLLFSLFFFLCSRIQERVQLIKKRKHSQFSESHK